MFPKISLRSVSTFVLLCIFVSQLQIVSASQGKPSDFDTYLKKKSSSLYGYGRIIDTYAQQYNVDPRLVIAIAGAETNFGNDTRGKNCPEYNNFWNILESGDCQQFTSIEDGIMQITAQLRQYREQRKLLSISDIAGTYCPNSDTGCGNWAKNVKAFYSELGGTPSTKNLRYPFDLGPANGKDSVDLWTYCLSAYQNIDKQQPVELRSSKDAYSWRCRVIENGQTQYKDVNVNDACKAQYGNIYITTSPSGNYPAPSIEARVQNKRKPYSWQCFYVNK